VDLGTAALHLWPPKQTDVVPEPGPVAAAADKVVPQTAPPGPWGRQYSGCKRRRYKEEEQRQGGQEGQEQEGEEQTQEGQEQQEQGERWKQEVEEQKQQREDQSKQEQQQQTKRKTQVQKEQQLQGEKHKNQQQQSQCWERLSPLEGGAAELGDEPDGDDKECKVGGGLCCCSTVIWRWMMGRTGGGHVDTPWI
jgi:hypothetical protein